MSSYDLTKEEDVKEYLNNIGIEYRFGCFSEKNPEVCHLLGDYMDSIKSDFEKAGKIYKSNCDEYSFPKSCYQFANYNFLGKGIQQNLEVAYSYYLKACDVGNSNGCHNSGLMCIINSTKQMRNYEKGIELLEKGCDMNNAASCYHISGLFIQGVKDNIDKDMSKAFQYTSRACELGNIYGCVNLSQMYARGEGVEKNTEKAQEFKKIATEMRDEMKKNPTLEFQQKA